MNLLQRLRAKLFFEPTDNCGEPSTVAQAMHQANDEPREFTRGPLKPALLPPSKSERTHQAWAAKFVREHGSITLRDIRERGCNHPAKLLHRLRKAGVVAPMHMDTWEQGRTGRFKRYHLAGRAV